MSASCSPSLTNLSLETRKAFIILLFPARHTFPFMFPEMPCPGICLKSSTGKKLILRFFASATIASANGCSESFSSEAAICSTSSSFFPFSVKISVTTGFPCVIVPVLSSTTVFRLWAVSSASADLIRIPLVAPRPVPTMIAVGVASPRAHGQDTTSTAIPIDRANSRPYPASSQTTVETIAIVITIGTKTPLTLSASFAIGAFELVASSTRRTIWASAVSFPTLVALILK